MKEIKLSNQEPKGTRDWLPEEMEIRQYIFNIWRKVCRRYGFQEYLTPIMESAEIYRAKSGEDVGGKELVTFTDLGGRELCIRPEMTPSVTRMVSKIYVSSPKPIRLFSIANFVRNEKPQRGRNREFWQLNCDTFGSLSQLSDLEILTLSLDIMKEFGAPEGSFSLRLNHRGLIDEALSLAGAQDKAAAARVLDKWNKLKPDDLSARLDGLDISKRGQKAISDFMSASNLDDLKAAVPGIEESDSYIYIEGIMSKLIELGYGNVNFDPSIIRGFDYYDGLIFEVFDNHPDNNRAMFGGGRYNGLAELFGTGKIPAVGFAPGDETTRLFLESWGMLDNAKSEREPKYYLPILDGSLSDETVRLSSRLRREGKSVSMGLEEQKLGKALEFASKNTFDYLVIFGKDEALSGIFKIKDMQSGLEKKVNL